MKRAKDSDSYFFVDESGDPTFYAKGTRRSIVGEFGCSRVLILGFIETQNPAPLRRAVLDLQAKVASDPYLAKLPSAKKTAIAFHAKDDAPEVRYLFGSMIAQLEFKAQLIVAKKVEQVFRQRYRSDENRFYDDLVTRLFKTALHRFRHNEIVFAARGSKARRKPLEKAIWRAKGWFEKDHKLDRDVTRFKITSQRPSGEPCLCIVDYINWAVYRAFVEADHRYYDLLKEKISFLGTRDLPELKAAYCRKRPYGKGKPPLWS